MFSLVEQGGDLEVRLLDLLGDSLRSVLSRLGEFFPLEFDLFDVAFVLVELLNKIFLRKLALQGIILIVILVFFSFLNVF